MKEWREDARAKADRPSPDKRTIREKGSDVKELDRKIPSDHIRDPITNTEPRTAPTEGSAAPEQSQQLSMDRYREAVKNNRYRKNADRAEAKTDPKPRQGSVSQYSDSRYVRTREPSSRTVGRGESQSSFARGPKASGSRSVKEPGKALSKVEKTGKKAVKSTGKTVKTAEKAVKTAEQTAKTSVKTAEKTVKTSEQVAKTTAKTAQKAAQAAAKAAKATAKAMQAAAKAAAKAAQTAAKAIEAAIKAIIAAIKGLIAAIAAGGWVAVVIILVIALIVTVLILCFGIFFSNDSSDSENRRPMTEAIVEINNGFTDSINAKITRFKKKHKPDETIIIYEGDTDSSGTVMNWPDVLAIYSVGTTTDPENPVDVLTVTDDKVNKLRDYFNAMNSVSYETEIEEEEIPALNDEGNPIFDDEGEQVMETKTTLTITITISCMDYRDAASKYNFNDDQMEMLNEIMRPQYYPMFAELLGDMVGDGGEFGYGLDINPDLPPNELGYQIVQAAKKYIGRSYASMDCSCLARTAYKDCGLTSMNGLSSVRMAQKCKEMGCLFTDPSQLQAGDLIFFARFDPKRGKDYCGDVNRCGTGKCRRWQHIHHVAIYINDEFLIDSTGGDNSVQIRKHWGMDTAKWKWVCFGRPTT